MASGVEYSINYNTKQAEINLKKLLELVKTHDELIIKTDKLIVQSQNSQNASSKERVTNTNKLLQAQKQLASVREKESKQILAIREQTKKINKDIRDGLKLKQAEEIITKKQVRTIKDLEIVTNALVLKRKNVNLQTKQGAQEYKELTTQIRKNNAELIKHDASIGRNQRNVGNYAGAIKSVAGSIVVLTASVVAFGTAVSSVTSSFAKFETGQTNVQTLLEETNESLAQDSIDLMVKYGLSIDDTNKALFDAVSAGVDSAKSIEFLAQATELAIGGNTTLESSVNGIIGVINAYGLELKDSGKVAAAFFSAQKKGVTTVAELTQEFGTVAPIANLAGISFQELLSTYAILTKQNIKTTDATTALKATISALIAPAEGAKEEFERLGIETGVVAIKNQGFGETLKQIAVAVEKDEDAIVKLIPNIRALTGVGALGTRQLEEYDEILKIVRDDYGENSSLAKAYEKHQKTLNKAFDRFSSQISAISIGIGSKLKPSLIFVLDNFKSIAKITSVVATAIAGLTLVTNGAAIAQKAYAIAVGIARKAQLAFNAVMAANPIGLVVTLLATAAAAFLAYSDDADEATESQKLFNEELEKTNKLQEDTKTLEEKTKIIEKLNKRQLEALQEEAKEQRKVYEDSQLQLDLLLKKRQDIAKEQKSIRDKEDADRKASGAIEIGLVEAPIQDIGLRFGGEEQIAEQIKQEAELDAAKIVSKTLDEEIETLQARNHDNELARLDSIIKETQRYIDIRSESPALGAEPEPIKIPIEYVEEDEEDLEAILEKQLDKEDAALKKREKKRLEKEESFRKEAQDLANSYNLTELQQFELLQDEKLRVLEEAHGQGLISTKDYQKALQAIEQESADKKTQSTLDEAIEKGEIVAQNADMLHQITQNLTQQELDDVEYRKQESIQANEEQYTAGLISKEAYEKKKIDIDNKALAEEKKIREKQRKWDIIQAAISGSVAVLKSFQNGGGFPWGLIPAGLMAGIVATQISAMSSEKFAAGGSTKGENNRMIMVNDGVGNKSEYVINGTATEMLGEGFLAKANSVKTKADARALMESPDSYRHVTQVRNSTWRYASGGSVTNTVSAADNSSNFRDLSRTIAINSARTTEAVRSLQDSMIGISDESVALAARRGNDNQDYRNA